MPSTTDAGVQARVRDLYEAHPYPPPVPDLDRLRDRRESCGGSPVDFHYQYWPGRARRDDLDVLVAGCGTSQAAKYAVQAPGLRVTGIDLSERSLAATDALAQRYGLDNLTLHQLPLERVAELGQTFDLVISTGVLHHLPDPDAGLRALRSVLRPDGAMHLTVYAPYGRTGIYMMQAYARLLGLSPTDDDLRAMRDTVRALPPDHPLGVLLRRGNDLTTPTGIADALLHPQDRAYSVPELYAWLERCGMAFMRWQHQAAYLPACAPPESLPHREVLLGLPEPQQHAAMELLHGTMHLHTFVAARDDRPPATYRIDFDAADWETLIPSRFEGAEAIQEGDALVLRNRAHGTPGLAVALAPADRPLCAAIDGNQTLGAIADAAGATTPEARDQIRRFFARLWRADLILVHRT